MHVNVPATTTSVERGGSETLEGVQGRSALSTPGYFGPCPPGAPHRYVFTVWALDAQIDFEEGDSFTTFFLNSEPHVLDSATITGSRGAAQGD